MSDSWDQPVCPGSSGLPKDGEDVWDSSCPAVARVQRSMQRAETSSLTFRVLRSDNSSQLIVFLTLFFPKKNYFSLFMTTIVWLMWNFNVNVQWKKTGSRSWLSLISSVTLDRISLLKDLYCRKCLGFLFISRLSELIALPCLEVMHLYSVVVLRAGTIFLFPGVPCSDLNSVEKTLLTSQGDCDH